MSAHRAFDASGASATKASEMPGVEAFDVEARRAEFPILSRRIHGKNLVYLDNANTSQKPEAVLASMDRYYREENANIHRGTHLLSELATAAYEGAREKVRRFVNAASTKEIVFVRGTTEAVNLVASGFGWKEVKADDEIVISALEHHSNIVPWQLLCERTGAKLRVIPINDEGEILVDAYAALLSPRVKLVSLNHVSNALGTVNPVKEMIRMAHVHGIPVFLDGAQGVPHMKIDVRDLDCDFYAFSGHKMYGPTGIGALYGRETWLERLPPYQGGGDMISSVSFEKTTYNQLPYKFEAGTANIAGGVGLGAAIDFLEGVGLDAIAAHEHDLLTYATSRFSEIPRIRIIGTARQKASVLSFVIDEIHPHDIGTILDSEGIAIRTGHHCAQPVMDRFNVPATARASFALYNTRQEVDALVDGLHGVIAMMG